MEHNEVMAIMGDMGLPFAYHHFAEGESPGPPFSVFYYPGDDNFAADGKVYFKSRQLHVEIYTDVKNPALEERVEMVLDAHGLFYRKTESWIEEEKLYEVLYRMEV